MIAAVAAAFEPDALAGGPGELAQHLRRDRLAPRVLKHGLGALGVDLGLIADGLEAVDAVLERRVVQVGDAHLDGVVEALEPGFRFRCAPVQLGDVLAPALGPLLPPVKHRGEDGFQPVGLEQAFLQMAGDKIVQLIHRHRHALASGRSLPGFHGAGIVTIAPALAGADGHGTAALGAMDQAGKEGRAANNGGWSHRGMPGLQQLLHGVEGLAVDDRRHRHDHDLADRLQFLGLGPLVELMLAHVGAAGQDAVDLADAPTPTIAGEDAVAVEIADDVLHAHLPLGTVAVERKPVDQPHRLAVERVYLQLLLDLRAALFGRDDTVADGRQRTIPEALPRILLQSPHDVLGVFLRLIFVEQRHDLPHHLMHRIVADLLGDRQQLDAVLRQLADVELHVEGVAEKAAERVDDHHVERRGLGRARLDHPLELGAAVVGRRRAWLHIGFDELVAARSAIGFALPLLVGDGDVMLGLPGRRDTQIERGAQGNRGGGSGHARSPSPVTPGDPCWVRGRISSMRSQSSVGTILRPRRSMRTMP